MKCRAQIQAGVCGFTTTAVADAPEEQMVTFEITTDCEKIAKLAAVLDEEPIDAYQEISAGFDGRLMSTVRANLSGCCAGCAVPVGLFKALQAAARVALPAPVSIEVSAES